MSFVPKPKFPDVPYLPGVPQLPRDRFAAPEPPQPVVVNSAISPQLSQSITTPARWGIYEYFAPDVVTPEEAEQTSNAESAGELDELEEIVITAERRPPSPVIEATSIYRIGYEQEYTLPTNPIQDGSFATFNKIATPYEVNLRMIKGGSLSERAKFLDDLERVGASLQLYRIVTPERTYQPVNISSFSVSREGAQGAYFFTEVDIRVVEIRQVTAQYSTTQGTSGASTANAQDPSALPTTNIGTLNSITPPTDVQTKVNNSVAIFNDNSSLF